MEYELMKKSTKIFLIIIITIILTLVGLFFYAFKIEPFNLNVNDVDISQNKTSSIKLVQFSDTHIKPDFTHENFQKVVDIINQQNADIVVFTGDLYDDAPAYSDDKNIIKLLKGINAKYGKFAVYGNHDYFSNSSTDSMDGYSKIMKQSDFKLLKNQSKTVLIKEKKLFIAGLNCDDELDNSHSTNFADPSNKNSDYNILLSHKPSTYEKYKEFDYNLILVGHTHGGQIKIPFISFHGGKKHCGGFFAGLYDLGPNKKLYTNIGIGTTRISARFRAVPEISVFDLPV